MTLDTGTVLQGGKYRILKSLGQGGFGITYEAEQLMLGRTVAIKEFFMKDFCSRDDVSHLVTIPSTASSSLIERFRAKFVKEAQMIAALNHPGVIKIHDIFEENGTAYYVMDYIPGGSLKELVEKRGLLPIEMVVDYVDQVGSALSYLHGRNILHLDIKPSNILLSEGNSVVLIDFGVSKHYDESGSQTSTTPSGLSAGFAPLEQYKEGVVNFTPATDIYSLGATMYMMATGSKPPHASDIVSDGLSFPSSNLPEDIKAAIIWAMSPSIKDRPQSIKEFLSKLDRPSAFQPEETTIIVTPSQIPKKKKEEVKIEHGHEYVDLGLSVKWATCNIGASVPEAIGNYYSWGDTRRNDRFDYQNYVFFDNRTYTFGKFLLSKDWMRKYNSRDKLNHLSLSDDTARAIWGGRWRMPTPTELLELLRKCQRTECAINGVYGVRLRPVSGDNEGIFIPYSGYRMHPKPAARDFKLYCDSQVFLWSSVLDAGDSCYAGAASFDAKESSIVSVRRWFGLAIRPVLG